MLTTEVIYVINQDFYIVFHKCVLCKFVLSYFAPEGPIETYVPFPSVILYDTLTLDKSDKMLTAEYFLS